MFIKTKEILDSIKLNMLFLALIHFVVTLYGDSFIFSTPRTAVYCRTKLFVLALLIWFWQKVPGWIRAYRARDMYIYTYIHAAGAYFLINFAVLLLTFPVGTVVLSDWWFSYNAVINGIYGGLEHWHHVLTSLFHMFAIELIPLGLTGVLLTQMLMISLIAGYAVAEFRKLYPSRYAYFVLIPFATPFVIMANLHPIRQFLYPTVILFFFLTVIFKYLGKEEIQPKDMIVWGILGALISTWRYDGVVFMLGVPVLIGVLFYKNLNFKKIITLLIVFAAVSAGVQRLQHPDDSMTIHYKLYNYRTTLDTIIYSKSNSNKLEISQLQSVNKFYDYSWDEGFFYIKSGFEENSSLQDIKELEHTIAKLVVYNFPDFVKTKFFNWHNFNHVVPMPPDGIESFPYLYGPTRGVFEPLNNNLRRKTLRFLLHDNKKAYFYNMYIPAAFLLILLIIGIIKRNILFFSISALLWLYEVPIFLFAGEYQLGYIYALYLCPCVFMTMFVLSVLFHVINKHKDFGDGLV